MAGAKRRHYRVAKKEAQMKPTKGVFIPKAQKNNILGAVIAALVCVFINGLLIGSKLGRHGDN